nr:hypothetical protein [Neobacillus sp. Marseille-Q6967]
MNLFDGLERNARNNSKKPAIIFHDKVYTYRDYNAEGADGSWGESPCESRTLPGKHKATF